MQATLGENTVVRILLDDALAIDHHDPVSALHGGEARGDEEVGAASFQAFECGWQSRG